MSSFQIAVSSPILNKNKDAQMFSSMFIFFKCKESCWLKVYRFNGWKKIKFWRKKKFSKNCFGASTFSAFSKGQKSTSKFWKTPEIKKMRNKTFKCSKLLLFFKTIQVNLVKNVKNCSKTLIMRKIFFSSNFFFFHPFESINFQLAGLLKIALIVTSLIIVIRIV